MINRMSQESDFVEVDPTGRYGRYSEILGKGASKIVYRAFDEYEGIEVAWNQVKLYDFLQSPEDLERLYCEIHLLKTFKHKNIMKLYASWVDTSKRNINFVTELFTSGTLRQYRQRHKRVNLRAIKHWCRQILKGLLYLHSHDPPVIHRDLKCDNIFINGNQGEVKIGDLGLAAILRKSHAAHCVGTPEFMAPEVYEEEYNELVDIYSFGMCVLEMVTFEYPYSECTHPAQIYKKVISGTMPEALYKVKDPEVRQFVEKCLATVTRRLTAKELLKDHFLQVDDLGPIRSEGDSNEMALVMRQPSLDLYQTDGSFISNGFSNGFHHQAEIENGWDHDAADISMHGMDLFNSQEDEPFANVDITIKGRRKEDGGIFLRLRIADKDGRVRNIYFPFDIEADTALSVATEMVAELDITDYEVTRIAEMIDEEILSLVPEWVPGPGIAVTPRYPPTALCGNCASNVSSCGSLLDYLSHRNPGFSNLQSVHCSNVECAATHGRFEEITYQFEDGTEGVPVLSTSQSDGVDLCSQASGGSLSDEEHEGGGDECCQLDGTEGVPVLSTSQSDGVDLCSQASGGSLSDEEHEGGGECCQLDPSTKDEMVKQMISSSEHTRTRKSVGDICTNFEQQAVMPNHGEYQDLSEDYENEIRQELRWLKAKYQMELREYRNRQLVGTRRILHPSPDLGNRECIIESGDRVSPLQVFDETLMKTVHNPSGDRSFVPSNCPSSVAQRAWNYEANSESSQEAIFTAKYFYATGDLLPNSIARTKSLPVDAVDV